MEPLDISSIRDEKESGMSTDDNFIADIETKEIVSVIDKYLDVSMRSDYLRMLHEVYVPKHRREQIIETITNIVREHADEEG